eukprot:3772220-Rhodomonas_salina.2
MPSNRADPPGPSSNPTGVNPYGVVTSVVMRSSFRKTPPDRRQFSDVQLEADSMTNAVTRWVRP